MQRLFSILYAGALHLAAPSCSAADEAGGEDVEPLQALLGSVEMIRA